MATLTDQEAFDISSLVYRRWAETHDNLKAVKAEKPNYKLEPDWDQMHAMRLANATKDNTKWKDILDRLAAQLPKLI